MESYYKYYQDVWINPTIEELDPVAWGIMIHSVADDIGGKYIKHIDITEAATEERILITGSHPMVDRGLRLIRVYMWVPANFKQ